MIALDRIGPPAPPTRGCFSARIYWLAGGGGGGDDEPRPFAGAAEEAQRTIPHVLIVEDELFVAWHIEDLVQSFNHFVCGIAARGEEAVERVADLRPNLVLMDVNLGGELDGVEAARRIRDSHAVPIVFITAYSDARTLARIREAVPGAAILGKPVTTESLRRAIDQALKPPAN